ncbi:MAG: nucleotide exchange factor GrpE [Epulopiscium sp. Nele67-Bin005]|nr:MAG: nucleotide exchange factor GrpE [Epulopiscium sp. Nele67-Bin005]
MKKNKNEKLEEEVVEEVETEEVAEETEATDENLERFQRLMAEFDNYRKRTDKEKIDSYDNAVSKTVTELLPVLDNFERALKQDCADEAFVAGVNMIYKQLAGALEKIGVCVIETHEQVFDPAMHNAIFHVEDENYGKGIIVEELQKGYIYKEKVMRHSLVKVAN